MSTTYGTIETEVLNNLGRTDDGTKAIVRTAFKSVQELLAASSEWQDLEYATTKTFTAGVSDYVEDTWIGLSDFKIYNLVLQDSTRRYPPMKYYTTNKWDEMFASVAYETTGRPNCWSRYAGTISIYPTPDIDYTARIRGYRRPVEVVDTATVLSWTNKDGLLVAATTALSWLSLEEEALARNYLNMTKFLMSQAGADDISVLNFSAAAHDYRAGTSPSGNSWQDPFYKGGK